MKRVSVRERNMKFLLEILTYSAIKERLTCIYCNCYRNSHMHNVLQKINATCIIATETTIGIITTNIVTHIFAAVESVCICAAETSNCIIATEAVTWIIATERSTNILVTKSTTSKP